MYAEDKVERQISDLDCFAEKTGKQSVVLKSNEFCYNIMKRLLFSIYLLSLGQHCAPRCKSKTQGVMS